MVNVMRQARRLFAVGRLLFIIALTADLFVTKGERLREITQIGEEFLKTWETEEFFFFS